MKYFMHINGQQIGPVEENEMMMNGLTPDTPVWCEGMTTWQKASTVPALAYLFDAPGMPPAPQPQPQYAGSENPMPGFFQAVGMFFSNYVNFSGRSRRSEYWWVQLFSVLVWSIFFVVFFTSACSAIVNGCLSDFSRMIDSLGAGVIVFVLILIFGLVMIVPSIALVVRRLHDIGKSGWYYFWIIIGNCVCSFIPILGSIISLGLSIWMLVMMCTDSERGTNKWGPSPKYND